MTEGGIACLSTIAHAPVAFFCRINGEKVNPHDA
jgi:hypothetical protein